MCTVSFFFLHCCIPQVRAASEIIACDIQPIQNLRVLQYVGEKKAEWGKYWIENGFRGEEECFTEIHFACTGLYMQSFGSCAC